MEMPGLQASSWESLAQELETDGQRDKDTFQEESSSSSFPCQSF